MEESPALIHAQRDRLLKENKEMEGKLSVLESAIVTLSKLSNPGVIQFPIPGGGKCAIELPRTLTKDQWDYISKMIASCEKAFIGGAVKG